MLTPQELERAGMLLDPQMHELEERIMSDIIRRIRINGEITSSADWQIHRLYELGMSKREIKKIIKETLDLSPAEISHMYKQVLRSGYARSRELYKAKGAPWIPFDKNTGLQQLINAVSVQTSGTLQNITQSLGFATRVNGKLAYLPIADYYQKTLDAAMYDIASGAFDYNTVLKRTVREMTNSGLRTIDYASGWANRVEVAARRAVMTGMGQLTAKINEDNARALETDWFEITWHSGFRPEHDWGGKWFRRPDLVRVCGLGTVTGLCGANCYHDYYPVIPGISVPTYSEEQLAAMNKAEQKPVEWNGKTYTKYEATQRQRALETTMRAQRQEMQLLKEGGADEDDLINLRARYRATSQEYARFSEAAGLPQQRERVSIDGLGNIMQGKYTGGSGKESPVKVPPVCAKRWTPVQDAERSELLEHPRMVLTSSSGSLPLMGSDEIGFEKLNGSKAISKKLADEYRSEYDRFTEMFGSIPSLKGVDIAPYTGNKIFGRYYPESRRIVIYGAGGKDGDSFVTQSAQSHKNSGEWSTGSKYHSFRHELGHALQMDRSINDTNWEKKRAEIEQIRLSIISRLTNLDGSVRIEEGKTILSKYGLANTGEFISESLAEYIQNPKKARSTAKKVAEIIMRGDA